MARNNRPTFDLKLPAAPQWHVGVSTLNKNKLLLEILSVKKFDRTRKIIFTKHGVDCNLLALILIPGGV